MLRNELSEADYLRIEAHNFLQAGSVVAFVNLLEMLWDTGIGAFECIDTDEGEHHITLITGGWSYNETILSAMGANPMLDCLYWESSQRGGKHVYIFKELPHG